MTPARVFQAPSWLVGCFRLGALLSPLLLMFGNKGMVAILVALAVPSGVALARQGCWKRGWSASILVAGGLLLSWATFSVWWAYLPDLVLPKVMRLLGLSLCGLVVCAAARLLDEGAGSQLLKALVSGFVVAAVMVVLVPRIPEVPFLNSTSDANHNLNMANYKNVASAGMVMASVALAMAWRTRARLTGLLLLAAILVLTVATGNVTGAMALIAVLPVVVASQPLGAVMIACVIVALIVMLPFVHLLAGSAVLVRDFPFLPNSLLHRVEIWRFAAERAWERPLLGWGLDASRDMPGGGADVQVWIRLGDGQLGTFPSQILPLHPHDFLLQVWLELGFVGVGLMVLLLGVMLWACRKSTPALAGFMAALTVAAASFSLWQSWWLATLFLAAAMAVAMTKKTLSMSGTPC